MKNLNTTNLLKNSQENILNCEITDNEGLNDFQKIPDINACSIDKVGIERFRIPLNFKLDEHTNRSHDCEVSMFVNLMAGKTGVNMSRFCAILQDVAMGHAVSPKFFKEVLGRFRKDLRDFENEELIESSFLTVKFMYPVKQKSLKSGNWGWQYYPVEIQAKENKDGDISFDISLDYEYSSTCPCSLSMAKQYEDQYRKGLIEEGNGIATAHSQRSRARMQVSVLLDSGYFLDDLIQSLRVALPTETQSLVKRLDEQAFAILNGENPMFVEHAVRRIDYVFNKDKRVLDWQCKVEHFESLHSHNAVAYLRKKQTDLAN